MRCRTAFGGAGGLGVPGPGTGNCLEGAAFAPCGHRFHPRPEDRPRSADPCPGDRSLRGTSSLRAMPAAARRLILASQGHARTGPLRFFDPLPPHVGLSRLLRGAWRARGRLPPASDPASGPIPGGFAEDLPGNAPDPASPPQRRFPSPALRRDPGKPPVKPGPTGCGFPGFALQGRSRICGGIPRKRPGRVEGNGPGPGAIPRAEMAAPSPRAAGFPCPPSPSSRPAIEYRY
jgi:hypothetical protein